MYTIKTVKDGVPLTEGRILTRYAESEATTRDADDLSGAVEKAQQKKGTLDIFAPSGQRVARVFEDGGVVYNYDRLPEINDSDRLAAAVRLYMEQRVTDVAEYAEYEKILATLQEHGVRGFVDMGDC